MQGKLIAELRAWLDAVKPIRGSWYITEGVWDTLDKMVSRHEAEQGEGYPCEQLKNGGKCPHRLPLREVDFCWNGKFLDKEKCPSIRPTPDKAVEPLAVESIEDLATRKGFQVSYDETYTLLHNPKSDMPSTLDRQFHLEREARAYLTALEDKEGV